MQVPPWSLAAAIRSGMRSGWGAESMVAWYPAAKGDNACQHGVAESSWLAGSRRLRVPAGVARQYATRRLPFNADPGPDISR
jgi:hypothetical protein